MPRLRHVQPAHSERIHVSESQGLHRKVDRVDCPCARIKICPCRSYLRQAATELRHRGRRIRVSTIEGDIAVRVNEERVPYIIEARCCRRIGHACRTEQELKSAG